MKILKILFLLIFAIIIVVNIYSIKDTRIKIFDRVTEIDEKLTKLVEQLTMEKGDE